MSNNMYNYKKGDAIYVASDDGIYFIQTKYVRTNKLGNIITSNGNKYIYNEETKQYANKYDREQKIISKKEYTKLVTRHNKSVKQVAKYEINRALTKLHRNQIFCQATKYSEVEWLKSLVDKFLSYQN